MSGLTRCNYCSLRDMRARAKARGVTVTVTNGTGGTSPDWKLATYSDETEPSAYFMELTGSCVC